MKILHTSDWHLGKNLENRSRLEEQKKFLVELTEIAEKENIDLIIIAGDIYDSANPPAVAEQLFYKSIKLLSQGGRRPIFIIAGNHDNPERIEAANPLSLEQGVIVMGKLKTHIPKGEYEHYSIINSGDGFVELKIKEEKTVIVAMPYPSDKRLNEIIGENNGEAEMQKEYSHKIGQIFLELSKNFRDDTINIGVGHFYIIGGETSQSERDISLGGAYAVDVKELPNAQYMAMGHLHRSQKVGGIRNAFYSGSPIQYSKSEANHAKCVYIAKIQAKEEPIVEKVFLQNYKPIEIWKCKNIEEALEKCKINENGNSWLFIEIITERPLTKAEIKEMRDCRKDIIEIRPILEEQDKLHMLEELADKSFADEFQDFYKHIRKIEPKKEVLDLFMEICNEEDLDEA